MTTRHHAPRFALALLDYFVPDSGPLAGDLVEEFDRRQSRAWFWWQVLTAIATALVQRPVEIRPLRLVDLQPADAVERARMLDLRVRRVNLSASPISGVGGLGLLALAGLVTLVVPGAWWALLASILAGVLLGLVLIAMHRKSSEAATTIQPSSIRAR
jgi:hypothetical protein